MPFHRLRHPPVLSLSLDPQYVGDAGNVAWAFLPGGYDYINNDPDNGTGVDPWQSAFIAPVDQAGYNAGTYLHPWRGPAQSYLVNRGIAAVAENTDFLDNLLRVGKAVPKTASFTSSSGLTELFLGEWVWFGDSPPNTQVRILTPCAEADGQLVPAANPAGVSQGGSPGYVRCTRVTADVNGVSQDVAANAGWVKNPTFHVTPALQSGVLSYYGLSALADPDPAVFARHPTDVFPAFIQRWVRAILGGPASASASLTSGPPAAFYGSIFDVLSGGLDGLYRRKVGLNTPYSVFPEARGTTIRRTREALRIVGTDGSNVVREVPSYGVMQEALLLDVAQFDGTLPPADPAQGGQAQGHAQSGLVVIGREMSRNTSRIGTTFTDIAAMTVTSARDDITEAEAGLTITRVVVGEPVTIKLRGNHRYEVTLQRSGAWFGKSFAGGPLRTAVVIGKTYLELTVTTTPGYPNLVFGGVVTGFDTMVGDALMTVYIAQGSGLTTKVLPLSELPAQASGQMRMLQPHLVSGRPSIAHRNRFETDLSGQWEVPNLQALFQLGYPDLLVARPPSTSLASATDTADDPAEVTSPAAATAPAQIVAQVEYGKRPAIEVCRPDYKGGVLTTLQATGMGDIANVGTPTPDRHFGVGRLREGVNHISVSAVDMTVTIPFWKAKHHVLHMVDPVTSPNGVPSRKRRMVLQVDPPDVLDRANLLAGYRVWSGEEFSVTVVTGGSEYFDMPRPVFDHIVFGSAPIAGAWTVVYWDEALAAMCRSDVPFGGEDPGAYVVTPRRGSTTFRFYCSDVRDIYCLTANLLGTAVNSLATRTLPVFRLLSHTINGYVQPVTS